jgi:hypothetical protein
MSDRIIRDEIWMSDRFLDLPTDTARVAFMRFIAIADDFGNLEGGVKRLFRILETCTQAKTLAAVEGAIDALMQADLIRRYTVDDRELFHIPRFHVHKQYVARKVPASPWCNKNAPLGKESRGRKAVIVLPNQGLASRNTPECSNHVVTTSQLRSNHVVHGVGDGEEKDQETITRRIAALPSVVDVSGAVFTEWKRHRAIKKAASSQMVIDRMRVEAGKAGLSLEAAMTMQVERGWQGFKADWVEREKTTVKADLFDGAI